MKRIMIVEDEPALLSVYTMLFKMHKYDVTDAPDGSIALKLLKSVKPDVIILDILMPIMGGIEFLKKADLKKSNPSAKVLVLSNLSDSDTIDKVLELGADSYMLKSSLAPNQLIAEVEKLLNAK